MLMLKILEKLVSFESTSQNFKEKKRGIIWISNFLKKFPLKLKYFEFSGHPSLVALTQSKKPKIFLAAHLDVVPASPNLFNLKIKNGRIFGRGVFDMKFAIACYLKLAEELKNDLKKLNLGIMITSDEEIGGFLGTKKLVEKGFKSEVVFLPDGGQNWEIQKEAKGVLHLKVKSHGKSAHGSRPWEGEGANEKLVEFLREFKKFFPKEPCKIKNHWHRTLTIGKIEGGKATNQVSDFAQAFLDIRFLTERERKKIEKRLRELKKRLNLKIEEIASAKPYQVDLKNKYIKIFLEILKKELRKEPVFISSHGSSDARFFLEKKIPVILTRPKGGNPHSENEWIDLKDLEKFYEILKKFVEKVAIEK
jgi:acetylornithine deacetylase/succinyl-diaminopimelate desuccinylase-like protein